MGMRRVTYASKKEHAELRRILLSLREYEPNEALQCHQCLEVDDSVDRVRSYFSPGVVKHVPIVEKPTALVAGRGAAEQVMATEQSGLVAQLITANPARFMREVALVGGGRLAETLRGIAQVTVLRPEQLSSTMGTQFSYVVVDAAGLEVGPWAHTMSTICTRRFLDLHGFLLRVKRGGTVVVLAGDPPQSHFTGSLLATASIRTKEWTEQSTRDWGPGVELPIVSALMREPGMRDGPADE